MSSRLFGTDGIRGTAGAWPLDVATVRRIGAALVRALTGERNLRLLIGRDTRESGAWIERELAYGASSSGAVVESAGVVPTPAVAFLTRSKDYDAGIMISASHNPFQDNGIKVFSGAGEKFTERLEVEVETIVADPNWRVPAGDAADVPVRDFVPDYLNLARRVFNGTGRLGPMPIVVDCANGATSQIAPRFLAAIGFDVKAVGCEPNGRNINLDCGSTAPQFLARTVTEGRYPFGVAFDGDGDRAIFVDDQGQVIDGDAVLLICGRQMKAEGRLRGDAVVATVMSNLGLELAFKTDGIELVRTAVGDKHVMEEMLTRGLSLGGEQSGHVIFADYLTTGDGLLTALNVLRTMEVTGRSLSSLASDLRTYPQVLLNVRVREKRRLRDIPAVTAVIGEVERRLKGRGRLLVRYSGTEPLLRVMLEGEDHDQIRAWGDEIVDVVKAHLG
jgi:phosphoglucosamine mutase